MNLHHDKEAFTELIIGAANELAIPTNVIEKDYYVTMILKQLAANAPDCVFKGGTSLSKCHKIIDRFSEDIDISFSNVLTQGQGKKLKDVTIAGISLETSRSME